MHKEILLYNLPYEDLKKNKDFCNLAKLSQSPSSNPIEAVLGLILHFSRSPTHP